MTDNQGNPKNGNSPTHILKFKPDKGNAPWLRIGAMWPGKTDNSFKVKIEAVPVGTGTTIAVPNEPPKGIPKVA